MESHGAGGLRLGGPHESQVQQRDTKFALRRHVGMLIGTEANMFWTALGVGLLLAVTSGTFLRVA